MKEALKDTAIFVKDIGFPIFVALYFLVSLGPKLDEFGKKLDRALTIMEVKK